MPIFYILSYSYTVASHDYLIFLIFICMHKHTQLLYVSSDPKDYQKEYKDSLMYSYVDFHVKWIILLNITIPPGPEAIPTTTKGEIIMTIISVHEEREGKERSNNTYTYLLDECRALLA